MKRMLSIVCVLATGLGGAAAAQAAPAATDTTSTAAATGATKIAVINFNGVVQQTNEFQRDIADLQKKYQPRVEELQKLNTSIESEKKELQDGGAKLADADRQAKLHDIDDKTKDLQRKGEDLRNDEQEAGQQTFQQVGQKVFDVMTDFAKSHGYNLVLDQGEQGGGVAWAADNVNISKEVLEAYNAKAGIPAPAAGAPSVPSAPSPRTGAAPRTSTPSKPASH
ncbi:MAG TPA: OmpH family outer membrane protein [Acidobacteriaceae bacterium]|nr:OmpH family outer membrane protein [Acidobacteriaceae bacterium]